jgi:hypothetical protein
MLVKGILGLFPFALAAPSCAHLPTLGGKLAITHGNRFWNVTVLRMRNGTSQLPFRLALGDTPGFNNQNPLILLLAGFGKP